MFEFKLQIGCLLVVLYITYFYIKDTTGKNAIKCNGLFDAILIISPWAIFFDGATAYTVNHMATVPAWANLLFHEFFLIFMDVLLILIFAYMVDVTIGFENIKFPLLFFIPGIISLLLITAFSADLDFISGQTTNYSAGISVIICFASVVIHFLLVCITISYHHRTIEKRKQVGLIGYVLTSFIILAIQIVFPEVLITSLLPTLTIIALYITTEGPFVRKLEHYNSEMVMGFSTLVENRDNSTGGHIKRTREYVNIIIKAMKTQDKYKKVLTKDYIEDVLNAAPMHDLGKISTPDYILQKPGKLTDEEFAIMKQHAPKGGEIIKETFSDIRDPEYLQIAYEVARYHHEKWNGRGYPDGLSGEDIPLHARIMAIADVFDAVSAKRCYRDALPLDTCFKIIEEGIGTDFDPDLAALFLNSKESIIKYYNETC